MTACRVVEGEQVLRVDAAFRGVVQLPLTYTLGAKIGLCCGCLSGAADAAGEDCCRSSNAREYCVGLWTQLPPVPARLRHMHLYRRQLKVSGDSWGVSMVLLLAGTICTHR